MYLTNITVFLLGSDKGHKFYMKMEKKRNKYWKNLDNHIVPGLEEAPMD